MYYLSKNNHVTVNGWYRKPKPSVLFSGQQRQADEAFRKYFLALAAMLAAAQRSAQPT